MRRISLRKFLTCGRALLFFGVFGGLLFSSSEGIRLFPFPPSEDARRTRAGGNGETGYQKNIHRFENGQTNQQTKSQRGNPYHFLEDFYSSKAALLHSAKRRKVLSANRPPFSESRLFTKNTGSRAPPFSL